MTVTLLKLWDSMRTSYWFVPTVMSMLTIVLVAVMLGVDRGDGREWIHDLGWIFAGGPDGAREVLATIASSMITVAGVVFSITIVALTLASQQFGPHILYGFMRDRGNQIVLGTFISTFLYSILILRTVRGEADGVSEFVPHVSVTVSVVLAILSLGVLIYYIHHAAMAIQAPRVVAALTVELHREIARYPEMFAGRDPTAEEWEEIERGLRGGLVMEAAPVSSRNEGYVQAMDQKRLLEIAREHDLLIRLPLRQGLFVIRDTPLASVAPTSRLTEKIEDEIRAAIALGSRRTALQDIEFTLKQLAEIAVRALSPGINDPFTASDCVDHLGAGLAHIIRTPRPSPARMDEDGRPRLLLERPLTFDGMMNTAFDQIRQNTGDSVSVVIRMLEVIHSLLQLARSPEEVRTLRRHAEMLNRSGLENFPEEYDRVDLRERFEAIVRLVDEIEGGVEPRGS